MLPSGCTASCNAFRCRIKPSASSISHQAPAARRVVAIGELYGAKVGQQQNVGRDTAHLKVLRASGIFQRKAA